MKPQSCSRNWQLEAARDGRLRGKDLDSALRHRETCAECGQVERELALLGQRIARLPELAPDQLAARRSRQRLMADLNATVLARPEPAFARRAAWLLALGAAVASWFAVSRHLKPIRGSEDSQSIIELRAEAGARWSERHSRQLDTVELADGAAFFTVHPHRGRRVVIQLPDGEIEDTGTVFEVRVHDQRTEHISVSGGCVVVRLRGRPDFKLGAGETWESESAPAASVAPDRTGVFAAPSSAAQGAASPPDPTRQAAPSRSHSAPAVAPRAALASSETADQKGEQTAAYAQAAKAEDESYLSIVDLLRHARYGEARAQAKSYLLRFPNGFRRIEVLNIATRAADDRPGSADSH